MKYTSNWVKSSKGKACSPKEKCDVKEEEDDGISLLYESFMGNVFYSWSGSSCDDVESQESAV